ncbi:hypothetical protein GH714_038227 [Hevea brasiliensis]|uniref:Uncharacterized protein n=1 Tax=Hevea brasiliensis TaxID=3981 RepID=A0A6A6N7E4_HEVBR|nr:hypothetical protein GH714_038227 [Hevea brasiliensis]
MIMEDFEKKMSLTDPMELETQHQNNNKSSQTLILLRRFLLIQQRRAQAYAKLKRRSFDEYMVSGGELAYQQLCSEITLEFNDCSKQVLEMEFLFLSPDYGRVDLAQLLRAVQTQEKQKLHLAKIRFLFAFYFLKNREAEDFSEMDASYLRFNCLL